MQSFDVIIVGAGHGGAQAAIALRQQGFPGTIALVGGEPGWPYERPPLSKDYLLGERPFDRMLIRPPAFWGERQIALLPGREVTEVDPAARFVTLADGTDLGYRALVWAAGGTPRRLSCAGADRAGVHVLRTRADVDAILAALPRVRRVALVGGGYIGLEAAAALRKMGKEVALLEAADRVLARVAAEPLSRFIERVHGDRGVDLLTGVEVTSIEGENGAAAAVALATGDKIAAHLVIVGIGISPNVQPLVAAGAEAGNGVVVDRQCRTTLPDIYAIGDCALHRNGFAGGGRVRLESVQNATDQANVVASTLCGKEVSYTAVPWFWSHQYDLKLQTVGLSAGHDATVVRGDMAAGSFSLVYLRDGRVLALDCVNAVKDYVQGRKLVVEGARISPERLADAAVPLTAML